MANDLDEISHIKLGKTLRNSPAGPLLDAYLSKMIQTREKQVLSAADPETFFKMQARLAELKSLHKALSREE